MWKKKIAHKKFQFILIGVVFFITAMIFNTCIGFVLEINGFSKKAINENNCPDGYILTIGSSVFTDNFKDSRYKSDIENVTALAGKTVTVPIYYRDKDITMTFDMMLDGKDYRNWGYMELVAGDAPDDGPGTGEVWISETLASPSNISLGDQIVLDYKDRLALTVSGIYRTTCFPKAIGYAPMLVSKSDLRFASEGDDAALFAVNVKDYTSDKVKMLFEDSSYCVVDRTRDDVQMSLGEYSGSIGAIGGLASFFVFLVTLFILNFVIQTTLLKDFRCIGVYKSLGYTSKTISGFYTTGYAVIGMAAIAAGSLFSLIIIQILGKMYTAFVRAFALSIASLIAILITFITLVVLMLAALTATLRKVKKITPVEAISIGLSSTEKKLPQSFIKRAKSPVASAVNELFKYKKSTVLSFVIVIVSIYMSLLFMMVWNSSVKMVEHANLWFCTPKCDVYVTGILDEVLVDAVLTSAYVKTAVFGDFSYKRQIQVNGHEDVIKYLRFDTYSELDEGITGIKILSGKAPTGNNEIIAGKNLMSLLALNIGDTVELTLADITGAYKITGTYNTVADGGKKIIMPTIAIRESIPDYEYERGFIQLWDHKDYGIFKKEIESKINSVSVSDSWFALDTSVKSIKGMLASVSVLLTTVFIAFSLLNIVIVIIIDNKGFRRKHGIMKALGFTSGYIVKQNLYKYFIISSMSAVIAFIIHLAISKNLMAVLLINAFSDSYAILSCLILGFIAAASILTMFACQPVKKISPVELMEE